MIPYKKYSLLIITFIFIQYCLGRDLNIKENQKVENRKNHSISSLDSLLLLKTRDCQIVMLSDSYHGHGYFMYKLTNFLNHWVSVLTMNMSDQTIPHKIVLFLENNSKVQEPINQFIDTGDISTFLNYYIDYDNEAHSNVFTVDYMIYLYKLRKIKLHIEELKKEKSEYFIDFKIMGAEDYPPYTFEDIINMEHQEFKKRRLLWYAFERDKLSSYNVYKFIKDNPDYKAIVFYGGPHLYRNKLPKNFEKDLINDDMYSFYMAHYLDSLFTRKKVSVFLMQPQLNTEKEFIEEYEMRSDTPDFVMHCKPKPFYPLTFSFVKTKTYLESLYDVLLKHANIQTKSELILARSLAFRLNNALMRTYIYHEKNVLHKIDSLLLNRRGGLKVILPEFIKIANELLVNYDVIKSLDKAIETITFNHFPDSLYYNRQLCQILTNIPSLDIQFTQVELYNNQNLSLTQIDRKKILKYNNDISNYLAVHSLFVAEVDEKNKLILYLKTKNGIDLNSEEDWLLWWYSKL